MPVYSLYQLHDHIRETLSDSYPDPIWITAEISSLQVNSSSGHCYLDLTDFSGSQQAKAKANLWRKTFETIAPRFERDTGTRLQKGLQVQILVKVEFHIQYGMSLTVWDIDSDFTIGNLLQKRAQLLKSLAAEGLLERNRQLLLPLPILRLAVISSPTAAGYQDFMHQLTENPYGFGFSTTLFPAVMQGSDAAASMRTVLQTIELKSTDFDAVILIRGGGSSLDLLAFDDPQLARAVALCPLPVLTGIGHERDDSVCDLVAHSRFKTPTAVANFLIDQSLEAESRVAQVMNAIGFQLHERHQVISHELHTLIQKTSHHIFRKWQWQQSLLQNFQSRMIHKFQKSRYTIQEKLHALEIEVFQSNPLTIIQKGYASVSMNGKRIRSVHEISTGEVFFIQLKDGKLRAENKGSE